MFNFDEQTKPTNPTNPTNPTKPDTFDTGDKMFFENYDSEKFELVYNKNLQKNLEKGINVNFKIPKSNTEENKTNKSIKLDELDLIEQEYLKFFI